MKIIEKLNLKNKDIYGTKAVTIAFLGDSITQGSIECYFDDKGAHTVFNAESTYSTRAKEMMRIK